MNQPSQYFEEPVGAEPVDPGSGEASVSPHYILAASPPAEVNTRVLKHGDTFAVFDAYGDVKPGGLGEEGLYHHGTRFLSFLLLALNNERPLFLSSTVRAENDLLSVDLTNPDIGRAGHGLVPRGIVHLARMKFLGDGLCYENLRIRNYGVQSVTLRLSLHFQADFADIFEVRGTRRPKRGTNHPGRVEQGSIVLRYDGLDQVLRRTRIELTPAPGSLSPSQARYELTLPPQGEVKLGVTIACEEGRVIPTALPVDEAMELACHDAEDAQGSGGRLAGDSQRFNVWCRRAVSDLHMMTTLTAEGPYPYAGVPWFSTAFGRDGIITALECLWLRPELSRGVLGYLAAHQATEVKPASDAEPGKILHEKRDGEMAALGEIPFGLYYGSIDSTPLFLMLAGAYFHRTGDRDFIERLWPHCQAALHWIDHHGDRDGDGFVEYFRQSATGLVHQGWKDSSDAIFHADGALAQGPIALCEVQGYVFAAKQAAANLAEALGNKPQATSLRKQAEDLRERFEALFWCEDLGTYALALDGDKRPCRVRTSNAGHCLFTGIATPEKAQRVGQALMHSDSFTGWGIRTVAASEARYNPMSYHNGSVWPHDNALIAAGLARYGMKDSVLSILAGMFEASQYIDLHRLPELFCGFGRRPGRGPTLYPVACAPQAWSAASVFLLLQAALGIEVRAQDQSVCLTAPFLPPFLRELEVRNLAVGGGSVDLLLQRYGSNVSINVLRREGDISVTMLK